MADIPDYQTLMLPVLRLASDGKEHRLRNAVDELADLYSLTDEQRAEMLPSGRAKLFYNRVAWAKTYLQQAGLLDSPKRGHFRITSRGQDLLDENLDVVNLAVLKRFDEFNEFVGRRSDDGDQADEVQETQSPEDQMEAAFARLQASVKTELLGVVKDASPAFFERLVVDLLVAMGYGGNRQGAARAVGKAADGGIDGVIDEDRLGLDVIYIQAKKWEGPVSRPEIQKFAGALQGKRARKGVFITTSRFTSEAADYARAIESKVILIDGERLTDLMLEFNVGVSEDGAYVLKSVDSDYFEE